jgi:hypothetical protein
MDDTAGDAAAAGAHQTFQTLAGTDPRGEDVSTSGTNELPLGGSGPTVRSALFRVIEGEIIPRLLLASYEKSSQSPAIANKRNRVDSEKLHGLAEGILRGNACEVTEELRAFRANNAGSEEIYCKLFAPLFREILAIYENDRCTLEEMILGISLIDRLLRDGGQAETLLASDWPDT